MLSLSSWDLCPQPGTAGSSYSSKVLCQQCPRLLSLAPCGKMKRRPETQALCQLPATHAGKTFPWDLPSIPNAVCWAGGTNRNLGLLSLCAKFNSISNCLRLFLSLSWVEAEGSLSTRDFNLVSGNSLNAWQGKKKGGIQGPSGGCWAQHCWPQPWHQPNRESTWSQANPKLSSGVQKNSCRKYLVIFVINGVFWIYIKITVKAKCCCNYIHTDADALAHGQWKHLITGDLYYQDHLWSNADIEKLNYCVTKSL